MKYTKEQKEAVLVDVKKGTLTRAEIAKKHNVNAHTVAYWTSQNTEEKEDITATSSKKGWKVKKALAAHEQIEIANLKQQLFFANEELLIERKRVSFLLDELRKAISFNRE